MPDVHDRHLRALRGEATARRDVGEVNSHAGGGLMPPNRKQFQTSQPPDLVEAIREQARRHGKTISAWVGSCCLSRLDVDLREKIKPRPKPGRPVPPEE